MSNRWNCFFALIAWFFMIFLPAVSLAEERSSDRPQHQTAEASTDSKKSGGGNNISLGEVGAAAVVGTAAVGLAVANTLDSTLGDGLSKLQPAKKLANYSTQRNNQEYIKFSCDTSRIMTTGHLASYVSGCRAEFLFEASRGDEILSGRFMPAKKAEDCDAAKKICEAIQIKMTELDGKVSIHHKDKLVGIIDFSSPTISFYSK